VTAVFAIALGAFIGAPLRALIEQTVGRVRSPLATLLLINSLGSLLAGFSIGAFTGDLRLFLVLGAAGAFTTFFGLGTSDEQLLREVDRLGGGTCQSPREACDSYSRRHRHPCPCRLGWLFCVVNYCFSPHSRTRVSILIR